MRRLKSTRRDELKRRARRLLEEKGRPFSGAMGYTRGAEDFGVAVISDGDWMGVHLPTDSGRGVAVVYHGTNDDDAIWAEDRLVEIALTRLINGQLLDDLSKI